MDHLSAKRYPVNANDYKLYEEVGEGVSATVHRALCIPLNEIVAIKVLDLEKCNNDLDGIRREVQTMTLIDHPNLLRAHCSFPTGHSLWVVMPYMAGGSCLHIMKSSFPEGFEEPVIATILREVLKALVYLHAQGHIHRDVKAGNILVDSYGAIKLADFGVSASMFTGDRQRSRNTFVGTPCWMAPEVMQQLHGYDFKADIWSFGITALELAHGHAPFSKYPPMKVLLMTLQNAPPGLDYERDKRFSKSFKELVATCLVKDPKKRPTPEKLLKHHFFKHARPPDYLARTILQGLAPLGERFRILKAKESDLLMQNKAAYENKDHLSQQEYIRGISAWNFNLEDLKSQAALIQDDNGEVNAEDADERWKQKDQDDEVRLPAERSPVSDTSVSAPNQEDELDDLPDLESSLASFPVKPLQALKRCFDIGEDDEDAVSPKSKSTHLEREQQPVASPSGAVYQDAEKYERESSRQTTSISRQASLEQKRFLSGSLIPDGAFFSKKGIFDGNRDFMSSRYPSERNYSGPLPLRHIKSNNLSSGDDTSEGAVVQRKGRFKVTSEDLGSKGPSNCAVNPVKGVSCSPIPSYPTAAGILSSLQYLLQQNTAQREEIVQLIKHVEQSSGKLGEVTETGSNELLQVASARERELQSQVVQLQQSIGSIVEELQKLKIKNAQLEKQVNALSNKQ